MFTMIGLPDPTLDQKEVNHKIRELMRENGEVTCNSESITVQYDSPVLRVVSPVNISVPANSSATIVCLSRAIWDTGAINSAISKELAERLNLTPVDIGATVTPTGHIDTAYYIVGVQLPNGKLYPNVKVAGYPLKNHDADFLIGMDIISKGDFELKNSDGKTVFTFRCHPD